MDKKVIRVNRFKMGTSHPPKYLKAADLLKKELHLLASFGGFAKVRLMGLAGPLLLIVIACLMELAAHLSIFGFFSLFSNPSQKNLLKKYLFNQTHGWASANSPHHTTLLWVVMAALCLVMFKVFRSIMEYIYKIQVAGWTIRTAQILRRELIDCYLNSDLGLRQLSSVSQHTHILTQDSEKSASLYSFLLSQIRCALTMSVFVIALVWIFGWWVILFMALMIVPVYIHQANKIRRYECRHRVALQKKKMRQACHEMISTLTLIQTHAAERREAERLENINRRGAMLQFDLFKAEKENDKMIALATALLMVGMVGTISLYRNDAGKVAVLIGSQAFLLFIFRRSLECVSQLLQMPEGYREFRVALKKIMAVAAYRRGPMESIAPDSDMVRKALEIKIHQLSFRHHPDSSDVLSNVSCTIRAGMFNVITGPSGSGKTTLIQHLVRLIEIPPKTVYINNQPLEEYPRLRWFQRLVYAGQEPALFSGSIRDNMVFGLSEQPDESEIRRALILVGLENRTADIDISADTAVGFEGLAHLSMGERQKVALARAFLRKGDLIILDEAMNSIDDQCASRILTHIKEQTPHKTVLLVTHQQHFINHADHLILMRGGSVVAEGDVESVWRRGDLDVDSKS